jgi:uncharacterized hydrophobic protein (TIGR00271 family)
MGGADGPTPCAFIYHGAGLADTDEATSSDGTMLHVRVVSPPELTPRLVAALAAAVGVRDLVVLPGAARRPAGDAVQFDVLGRHANPVLQQLRDLRLDGRGSILIETVDATLTVPHGAEPTADAMYAEAAPVWELVEARIRAEGVYPPSFFILLVIAGLIGAVGILTNSTILIVGAMVVSPEYNAIVAVALGVTERDARAIRSGVWALVGGFAATIAMTYVFASVVRWSGQTPTAFDAGLRPVSDLINAPDLFSVVVAVLAGIVGIVSLTEARAGALIGVFISITTIPAAADIAVSSAFESWYEAVGSTLQLLLNVVLLLVVSTAGLAAQRAFWRARTPR